MQLLCTPVEELNNGLETFKGKEINIAGIITAKREGKTKTGKDFGILTWRISAALTNWLSSEKIIPISGNTLSTRRRSM